MLHNDEPTVEDRLERRALVLGLSREIATCRPPHVFGVHGDWGAGKTSFLWQVQACLTGSCPQAPGAALDQVPVCPDGKDAAVVWFEAWRYQHDTAPIVALLHEIRAQLPWVSKAISGGKKLGEVAIRAALLSLEDLTKKIGIQASKIEAAGQQWEAEHLATTLPSHTIRQHLQHALDSLLGRGKGERAKRRLVVVVDDLDRCESRAAYQLLEGIKIYLNLPSCVFVLGMNSKVLEDAIALHIPNLAAGQGDGASARRAREYLEKLCQTIVHLPILRDPAGFLEACLGDEPMAPTLGRLARDHRCVPANARKVKALANLLLRSTARRPEARAGFTPQEREHYGRGLLIMGNLYLFQPELYRVVEAHPRFYKELVRWAQHDPSAMKHPVFEGLERELRPVSDDAVDKTPLGARPPLIDAFSDPAEGHVFRLQNLIEKHGEMDENTVRSFLLDA